MDASRGAAPRADTVTCPMDSNTGNISSESVRPFVVFPTLESFISGTEPGEGSGRGTGPPMSKKPLENRILNGGCWGHFKLKIVNICYCFSFAGKNVFTANLDPPKIILSELICVMEMP